MRASRRRWMPVAAVPVVVAAAAVIVPAAANADPALPRISSQELLELVAGSAGVAYSGTIEQNSDLGLPDLGSFGDGGSNSAQGPGDATSSALELLTASHTAKVYVADPDTVRVQVLDQLAERDLVRDGQEAWLYDSESGEATRLTLPAGSADRMPVTVPTPAEYAGRLLTSLDASTAVTVTGTARVAGRAAYELTLTPRTDDTLVGSVSLSVDAETGLPLSVEVLADGQEAPAFSIGLTSVSFDAPDADLFAFSPPAGSEVVEHDLSAGLPAADEAGPTGQAGSTDVGARDAAAAADPTVIGEGWSAIVAVPAAESSSGDDGDGDAGLNWPSGSDTGDPAEALALLEQATTPVNGGRVLETALLSVLITDDGRVLLGAVPADALEAAAAQ